MDILERVTSFVRLKQPVMDTAGSLCVGGKDLAPTAIHIHNVKPATPPSEAP